MTTTNPWLDTPPKTTATTAIDTLEPRPREGHRTPVAPQPGVPAPDVADRLPRLRTASTAPVWWVGTHGGAGESTLASLACGTRAALHAWPVPDEPGRTNRVLLVARTNYAGLISARNAATEWAAGTLEDAVTLLGLVLIADMPGRAPKPLRDLEQIVSGGVPRVWRMPWIENWRLRPADPHQIPREYRALLDDLKLTTHRKDQA